MKAAIEEWTEEQCKNIDKGMMSGNRKKAYNTLKALTTTKKHKSAVIEDSSGSILTESTAVLNRCTEFYAGLYNYKLHPDISLHQSNHILVVWANHSTPLHPVPLQPLPPKKNKQKHRQTDRWKGK